jgi:hypothetical protein
MNRKVKEELLEQVVAEPGLGGEDAFWDASCSDQVSSELPMWAEREESYRKGAALMVEALRQVTVQEHSAAVRASLRNRGGSNRMALSRLVVRAARKARNIRIGLRKLGARQTLPLNRLIIQAARNEQEVHSANRDNWSMPTVATLRATLTGRSPESSESRRVQRLVFGKSKREL